MGQKFYSDKILGLSYSAGVVTLGSGSILTIGGQQYTLSANVNLTLPTLASVTLYMLYAVASNGVVSLVQSTNVNSVGPSGQNAWKLVGAYYSNGIATPAFGAFVSIEGVPTSGVFQFTPTIANHGTVSTVAFYAKRQGGDLFVDGTFASGTVVAGLGSFSLPGSLALDTTLIGINNNTGQNGSVWGHLSSQGGITGQFCVLSAPATSTTLLYMGPVWNSASTSPLTPANAAYSNAALGINYKVPISGWDSKPLRDL